MSSGYSIFSPAVLFSDDEDARISMGLRLPPGWKQGRNPTAEDFRSAFAKWDGCLYEESIQDDDLTIWVTEPGENDLTMICIRDYIVNHTEENTSVWLSFTYGHPPWLVTVTERLAQRCGPLLLTDSGGALVIVSAGMPPDVEWAEWPSPSQQRTQ